MPTSVGGFLREHEVYKLYILLSIQNASPDLNMSRARGLENLAAELKLYDMHVIVSKTRC